MRAALARFFLFCLVVCLSGQPVYAGCPKFSDVITTGAYGVADERGNLLGSCNVDVPLVPASIIKIPTALAALRVLGPEYRFKTEFYLDAVDNLYIRGFGDPLLISEEVLDILRNLHRQGVKKINSIYIDDSAFALEYQPPGRESSSNPYDAPIGATVVNFNSVAIKVRKHHRVRSTEPQTPTLPIMKKLGRNLSPGRYLINVCQGSCQPEAQMARFTAELFRALQNKVGIGGQGSFARKKAPAHARLVYFHKNSRQLDEVLASMLKYSSNFIANLLYLTIGAEKYGYPATWAKANRAVHNALVSEVGVKTAALIVQEEGAGLSRNNRVTARAMLRILKKFSPHAGLLRKRRHVLVKSGTMKGIFNYAGYLQDGKPFVVLLNQQANTRGTVLARLKRGKYPKLQRLEAGK
jgi:D-alanyl-D-alanine carboxypeptidase/D-alanyl-D-alanine-endopeptidase (penicillin-binding protein 4)